MLIVKCYVSHVIGVVKIKLKYKNFYMMFDKRFKNLILCSNLNSDGGVDKGV